ncbi:MAG: hypothetical protein M5U26_03925 [Planctomycetota bacterium]|nr:hypothetical protein [Planctomycetota bacterium]
MCAVSSAAVETPAPPQAPGLAWHTDLGRAFTAAREADKRVLLLLERPDQSFSRRLAESFDDEAVAEQAGSFVPVRLNLDVHARLLERFVVRIVPDLRVFDPEGRQVAQESGGLEPAALKEFLAAALKARPEPGAPLLSALVPGVELDALARLDAAGRAPEGRTSNASSRWPAAPRAKPAPRRSAWFENGPATSRRN